MTTQPASQNWGDNETGTTQQGSGYTLIELIMVIVIISILAVVITPLIGNRFASVDQSTERARWVQQAEYAFFHIRQDLSMSAPNSVQTSEPLSAGDQVVEFLASTSEQDYAARYRTAASDGDALVISADVSFDIFGSFTSLPDYLIIGAEDVSTLWSDWESLRAGGNSGTVAQINSSTSATDSNTGSAVTNIAFTSHTFPLNSPYFRTYFADGPVAYQCDASNGFLYRVSGYQDLSADAFLTRTAAAEFNRVISDLVACEFSVREGSTYTPPTLRVDLTLGSGDEQIRLIDTIILANGL